MVTRAAMWRLASPGCVNLALACPAKSFGLVGVTRAHGLSLLTQPILPCSLSTEFTYIYASQQDFVQEGGRYQWDADGPWPNTHLPSGDVGYTYLIGVVTTERRPSARQGIPTYLLCTRPVDTYPPVDRNPEQRHRPTIHGATQAEFLEGAGVCRDAQVRGHCG